MQHSRISIVPAGGLARNMETVYTLICTKDTVDMQQQQSSHGSNKVAVVVGVAAAGGAVVVSQAQDLREEVLL